MSVPSLPSLPSIPDINAQSEVDVQDSCNCWSLCCPTPYVSNQVLDEKIRRIVMDELEKRIVEI